ncbi:MAG: carboxypeptidase regulatory-like domain-containing protein [Planctomycetaceae bacterium]|nr:carboxypeptidase regulatory-like domain-containing protein [Planctomycetaceae bacterium]
MSKSIALSVVLFSLSLVGCGKGDGQKPVYPVSGKVTMAGAPVAKATVVFGPLEKQPVATAITDANGEYKLTTYDSFDGAAAGKYEVTVSKVAVTTTQSQPAHDPTGANKASSAPTHSAKGAKADEGATIDPKWSRPGNGLNAEVKSSGENKIDLKLD